MAKQKITRIPKKPAAMKAAVPVPAKKRKAPKAPVPGHDDAAAEVSADEDFDLEDGGQEEEEEGGADTELWTAMKKIQAMIKKHATAILEATTRVKALESQSTEDKAAIRKAYGLIDDLANEQHKWGLCFSLYIYNCYVSVSQKRRLMTTTTMTVLRSRRSRERRKEGK